MLFHGKIFLQSLFKEKECSALQNRPNAYPLSDRNISMINAAGSSLETAEFQGLTSVCGASVLPAQISVRLGINGQFVSGPELPSCTSAK